MLPLDEASALRLFLVDRDTPCPSCGYNLRSLASGSCPECDHVPRLQLARVDRPGSRMYAFVLALCVVGAIRGGVSAFQSASDLLVGRPPIGSNFYAVVFAMWIIAYLWLGLICILGVSRLVRQRGTDKLGATVNRLLLRLLAFLLFSLAMGLVTGVARILQWL